MTRTRYVVIVHPPRPTDKLNSSFSGSANEPKVKRVTASGSQEAASSAEVKPGGHAFVVKESDMVRFDRAEQAPLERREVDGTHLPQAAVQAA